MAAGNSILIFRGLRTGKPVTMYTYEAGADAVGVRLPVDSTAIATAESPTDFNFDEPMQLVDCTSKLATPLTGTVRFVAGGIPSQATISFVSHSGTNAGRPREGFRFRANVKYEIQVTQILDA